MKIKKCPCCGNGNLKLSYENLYDKDFENNEKFSMIRCENCDFEFVQPLLNEKQLQKFYPAEEYYSYYDYNKMAVLYHRISAFYFSGKSKIFNLLFAPISPLFYTYYIDEGKSVLEVGCGNGMKLEIYQKYGMKTFGVEPYGPPTSERDKKLGIIKKSVKDVSYKKDSFDYIILKEVLEHIPNQKEVLQKCRDWLKPGGKLIITVPNSDGFLKKIFKQNWYGYDVPRHCYNYNPNNLEMFLKKLNFKIIRKRVYELPYMFDGSLKFHLTDKTGKREHKLIFSNFAKLLFVIPSLFFSFIKIGSIMEVHCTK